MELIIDIPEEVKSRLCFGITYPKDIQVISEALNNGTPLPKGHGDLKDADTLKHAFVTWSMAVQGNFTDADIASIVCNSPTIIEADKENK